MGRSKKGNANELEEEIGRYQESMVAGLDCWVE